MLFSGFRRGVTRKASWFAPTKINFHYGPSDVVAVIITFGAAEAAKTDDLLDKYWSSFPGGIVVGGVEVILTVSP